MMNLQLVELEKFSDEVGGRQCKSPFAERLEEDNLLGTFRGKLLAETCVPEDLVR
jgi:hypothetical protein